MRTTQVVKGLELMPGLSKAPSELCATLCHRCVVKCCYDTGFLPVHSAVLMSCNTVPDYVVIKYTCMQHPSSQC